MTMKKKPRRIGPTESLPARRCKKSASSGGERAGSERVCRAKQTSAAGSVTRPRLFTLLSFLTAALVRRFCAELAVTCALEGGTCERGGVEGRSVCCAPLCRACDGLAVRTGKKSTWRSSASEIL